MKTKRRSRKVTIGLDLGDRKHSVCVLDSRARIVEQFPLANKRERLALLMAKYPRATVAMEAGRPSPWISRLLAKLGAKVIVANPRKLAAIYQNERKSDRRDAETLARLARMDPALLHPIQHGSAAAQQDMLQIKLRDALVRARVALINSVRFTLKSLGHAVANPSSERFHKEKEKGSVRAYVQNLLERTEEKGGKRGRPVHRETGSALESIILRLPKDCGSR